MRFDDLAGRSVVIWGAGREGRAARAELERRGIDALLAVTGEGPAPADLAAFTAVGDDALARLEDADVVVKSPGVPRTSPEMARLREHGVAITSLTDLWLNDHAERVVAVTGTKGKSTTSSLVRHLLVSLGVRASLVGNGGTPVTDDDSAGAEVAVTEVSSYQAADLTVSPRVAVVTSLFPEHLPWHGGYDAYVADKLNLVAHDPAVVVVPDLVGHVGQEVAVRVGPATRLVVPADLGLTWSDDGVAWDGVGALGVDRLPLHGRHNHANVALALAAVVSGFDVPDRVALLEAVTAFAPLAHRLEPVPSDDGRQWVDDSLATAPEAVVAALETFPEARVALVLGGADRGLAFEPLAAYLAARPASAPVEVVAIGPAGARWADEGGPVSRAAAGFADAMRLVRTDLAGADVVLLSPGAPSFDEFASYEHRAAAFRAAAIQAAAAG